ncbi:tetratricopeptide repeat protein [Pararhodospirillum photometricum]|nr:tetratricopeptide repeat protein [Pararhodospirillum photometricum]
MIRPSFGLASEIPMADLETTLANGFSFLDAGQVAQAEQCFRAVLTQAPQTPRALTGLGLVALRAGQGEPAQALLEQALRLDPRDARAREALLEAVARTVRPEDPVGLMRLGRALAEAGDAHGAREAYVAALVRDPLTTEARFLVNRQLPRVYQSAEDMARWRARFATAVQGLDAALHPQSPQEAEPLLRALLLRSNFELAYQGQDDRPLQEVWGRLVTRVTAAAFPDLAQRPAARPLAGRADPRLRIGYASSCFSSHTIALLFNSWIRRLDRSAFKVHVYVLGGKRDSATEILLNAADVGRDLRAAPLGDDARTLRADELDILIYPDLGMDARSFLLASLPLAPVQGVSWGHPVTTGLPSIDWFLSSEAMEPAGAEAFYSERLVRLPRLSIAYTPTPVDNEKSRAALGLPSGVLYLCVQALQKYLPAYDGLFPAIARHVPEARFVFIEHGTMSVANRLFRERLERAFRAAGLDPAAHLVFLPWLDWRDYLALNGAGDVFLDSVEWSGGNTTLEALSRGVPPVTLPRGFMRGRHTAAMLSLMGLNELIARDLDDYVRIAVRLGQDSSWRRQMREAVVARRAHVFEDNGAVRALEDFYRQAHALSLAPGWGGASRH